MAKNYCYSVNLSEKAEELLKQGEYLGEGHNGVVFLLPDNNVIKIFKSKDVLSDESSILYRTRKSKYFPHIVEVGDYYIIREYVEGERLDKYLKQNSLNIKLSENLFDLIEEFSRLHFKRKDLRCKDIFVRSDMSLMIIDPKNNYDKEVNYPRHLMKGLSKAGVLEDFLNVVKQKDKKKYRLWKSKINKYLKYHIK